MPRPLALVALLALPGCEPAPEAPPAAADTPRGEAPDVALASPTLRRLTQDQYANTIEDLLGEGLVLPSSLEPDTEIEGLREVGASATSISSVGIEQYEDAAFSLAEQVMAEDARAAAVVGCDPAEDGCLTTFVTTFGRRAWRRSLSTEEVDRIVAVGELAAATLGDTDAGATYALATVLQSPYFLYRVELGETDPDDPARRRYTSTEMATRLSYFFWNSTPDDTLLDAGETGALVTDDGLAAEVDRLLADERAHEGVRAFFTDVLRLYELDDLAQDPTLFTHMGPEVGPSGREETLLGAEAIVFGDEDWRTFFTTRRTYLDPVLAALYNVRAPTRDGFGETALDAGAGRVGYLGQVSFLALNAHPTTTSATLRGKFIREVLLCQDIPPPPADVDASIPEVDEDSPTLRDRLTQHMEDPTCSSCHQLTDPVGLGLENFDAIGMWRLTENGVTIDPSGSLDGQSFADAVELGAAVAAHDQIGPCFSRTLYRYATGRTLEDDESDLVAWHAEGFEESGYRVKALLTDIATSPGFRRLGEVE